MGAAICPSHAIRVGLSVDVNQSYFGVSSPGEIINAETGKTLYKPDKMKSYAIKAYGDNIAVKINNKFYDLDTNYIKIKPGSDKDFVATKGRWYRGELIVYNFNRKLTIINVLPLETYLLGVVPSEMPVSWNYEAHKAQAIAARSYSIANLK